MLIRAVIKFFRKRDFEADLPMATPQEQIILKELFTMKNYVPHSGARVYRSFNTEFRDWIFSLPAFCHAFTLYHGKINVVVYYLVATMRQELI
jgi:hypothetical protein